MSYDPEKKINLGGLKESLYRAKNYADYAALKAESKNNGIFLVAYPLINILSLPIALRKEE